MPRSAAEAWRTFLTTYGTSTSVGPRKARYAIAADPRVPQSHTCRRTKRSPSPIAARVDVAVERPRRDVRTATIAPVEAANVAASRTNAVDAPKLATIRPPSAGPARRRAMGRTNWSSEFAAGRWSVETRLGTIASKAGTKKAPAAL